MFKTLVVGALATGIALTGGMGASASTHSIDAAKKETVTNLAIPKEIYLTGYASRWDLPNVTEAYGIKWYLKGAWQEPNGTWTGYYQGHMN